MEKVVVLLPEGKLFDLVFSEGIVPALTENRRSFNRPSVEFSAPGSLGALCHTIESADLIIADLTGQLPNIFYLTGYAQALGKKVWFLVPHLENFPFDSAKQSVISYAGDRRFLKDELSAFLAGKTFGLPAPADDAKTRFASIFGDILATHRYEHDGRIELENPTTFVLHDQDMGLALVQDLARRARELGFRLKLM